MNAKILKTCLILFALMVFSGCACSPVEVVKYVDRPYEVKVPVACVVPDVACDANQSTYTGIVKEMRLCIERYKEAVGVCR